MNSNLGQILVEDDNIGYQNNQFIFQIGVGYLKIINGYINHLLLLQMI